jgi:ribonuclease-3
MATHKLLKFRDQKLLEQALTHSSYANENPGNSHNERLEFLGDALLNFLSGEYLYLREPLLPEGEMTWRRSHLVDEQQLAKFAQEISLGQHLRLGKGLSQSGGDRNPNLLSSAFEAVVGAYYLDSELDGELDGNLDSDRSLENLRSIMRDFFDAVLLNKLFPENEPPSYVDAKNQFQVWVQANFNSLLPRYVTDRIGGSDHAPEYLAKVFVAQKIYGEGKASGKKEAEKKAAAKALAKVQQNMS